MFIELYTIHVVGRIDNGLSGIMNEIVETAQNVQNYIIYATHKYEK